MCVVSDSSQVAFQALALALAAVSQNVFAEVGCAGVRVIKFLSKSAGEELPHWANRKHCAVCGTLAAPGSSNL